MIPISALIRYIGSYAFRVVGQRRGKIIATYGFNLIAMVLAGKESGMQNVPFSEKVRRIVL